LLESKLYLAPLLSHLQPWFNLTVFGRDKSGLPQLGTPFQLGSDGVTYSKADSPAYPNASLLTWETKATDVGELVGYLMTLVTPNSTELKADAIRITVKGESYSVRVLYFFLASTLVMLGSPCSFFARN